MHETSAESNRLIRFGVFELDLRSGELRKSGGRLNLQQQPLQLLSVLLEQPGEIVTRDTLRRRLWPEDTFVDFEHGLNAAVKRLRDTLGDAAELPRFIETIPRRGYRFIAPVTRPDVVAVVEEPVSRRPRVRWPWVAAAAGALALVVGLSWRPPARVASSSDPASAPPLAGPLIQLTTGPHFTTEPAVSADGEWLAYASDRSGEGHLDIWMQRLSGGEPVRLTDDRADDREPTFSADGGLIAFRSEREGGGIHVIPAHSGGEARLLVRGSAHGPRFSPDGRWLAYSTGAGRFSTDKAAAIIGQTYIVSSKGGESHRLLPEFASASWPVWSPDSRHLLLTARRGLTDMPEWWVVSVNDESPTTKVSFDTSTGTSRFPVRPWRWLDRDRIVYSTALGGDSWDLWEVAITRKTWAAVAKPRRLTMGAGVQGHASIAPDNVLVFANLTQIVNVWSIPLDANSGRVAGPMQRVTASTTLQWWPSASNDGRLLVFGGQKATTSGVWLHDFETARETLLAPARLARPVITGDGSRVAYQAEDGRAIYAVASSGGPTEKLCVDCGQSWVAIEHWSADKTRLLYETGNPSAIFVLDLRSGAKRVVVQHASYNLWQARFSPDDRWISFLAADAEGGTRLWIVPFAEGSLPREQEWIAVTDGQQWDDKPRWSPDGNLIYFTSLRDGFHCLWAQRLRPENRQPIGPALPVQHLHSARLSVDNAGVVMLETAVTRDKLLINLGELSGNIWTTSLR